ncbi:MAG: CarD family transcriptional regulator [Actinobacteria bacterium]|jgi:CarD family transcriptional regulator|nr:CarD family transcriptional regulator [Acidimicrobiaceae bacterium]MDG1196722.1 CarD family transcriptional regulator [Actinomycetota bacterium]MDG2120444.1 CarD family transcriptional regulator [Actinomycetota bacterium]NCG39477.1 CarD family transcriptional regulator [Actinomycetota bacterium]|tara:strand:+ start:378 stop:866 length:489 start_codon:yes stop_codon:yes gene_type:complete
MGLKFDLGDRVIYPHHGAALITSRETRKAFGETREYLILETAHGDLTLSVPTDMIDTVGMRPPIDEDDVADLFELLAKKDIREPANWSRRFKNHQEKLKSGDIYQVAEVVRNLALRESSKGLSAGEKSMLDKSRQILISELSISMDVTEEEASEQVEIRLAG